MRRNRTKLICALLVLVLAVPLMAATRVDMPKTRTRPKTSAASDVLKYIDVNSLLMFATNYGNFAYDASKLFTRNDGLYFPFTNTGDIRSGANDKHAIFDAGIWMGAKDSVSDSLKVTVAEYSTEYTVGNMADSTFIAGADVDPNVRTYVLYSDSMAANPGADYNDWPVAQGAPVDSLGHPKITGDKMLWSVYNDADPALHNNQAGSTSPMGVEIQQSTFAFKQTGPLANIAFLRYKIKNKGTHVLDSMYVSIWSDPDLGGATDDLVGCDTSLTLGFCYNGTNNDAIYGSTPPCVGMDFFQGPLILTGDSNDVAIMWDGQLHKGYKNMSMTSFNKYINGTDPKSATQSYNFMKGLNADGTEYSFNGIVTKFFNSGDPVAGTGDLDFSPADRRMELTTGPFTFRPGDSTEILAAIILGQGSDRQSSISVMKFYDKFAKNAYKLNFNVPKPPVSPVVTLGNLENQVTLHWTNASELNHGDLPFQGYTVYQGQSQTGPWKRVANYDINDGVGIIFDDQYDAATGVVINAPVKFGSDNGLKRYFTTMTDAFTGARLSDVSQYYFKVEAYSYSPLTTPKTQTSETIIVTTPQKPIAGLKYSKVVGDSLADSLITHVGGSDGSVKVYVVDPTKLTGHRYKVEFFTDSTLGAAWRILDSTAGDTVVKIWTNQSGDNDYPVFDGLLVKVFGPALNFKDFQTVANGAGALVPPEGAAASFQGFPGVDPTARQQTNGQRWLIHTGDDGTRGAYDAFLARTTRDGDNWPVIIPHDYEIRFTAGPNWGVEFNSDSIPIPVPFELWDIGVGTPNDPSDDYRLIPKILDIDANNAFNLSSYGANDHTVSGDTNDPYTDWIYWERPSNETPGHAGYDAFLSELNAGTWAANDNASEIMARMVFVGWNLGYAPPFNPDMPEPGTVLRILTTKPNRSADSYAFSAPAPGALTKNSAALANIRAVPNPYYLFSSYDTDVFHRQIRFTNLPQQCSISIYNLAGDKIAKVDKNSTESWTSWNIQTSNGTPVASGIYIYVVDAPGYGQKVGKLAVFTEVEQLKTY